MRHLTRTTVLGLLVLGSAASAATNVVRAPTVQNVDQTSAEIGIRLGSPCAVTVRYGVGTDLSQSASSTGSATQQFVKLTPLQPGTVYAYQVDACGSPLNLGGKFATAPKAGARTVHFAAMGDFGTGGSAQQAVAQSIVNHAPEFWLALGDDAYDSGAESDFDQHFFAPMTPLLANVPVFPSPGNHEYVTNNAQPYVDAFDLPHNNPANSERYYSFDWGAVHVVSLDSMCMSGTSTSDCTAAAQKTWLQQDLQQSKAPWKVVIFHHPVYSSGEHGSSPAMQALIPTFEAGGVDLVLTGHDHTYERTRAMKGGNPVADGTPGAITYVVVGTGGAGSYAFSSSPAWDAFRTTNVFGFLDVTVTGGTLTAKLVTSDGKTPDTFTLTKQLPAPTVQIVAEPATGLAPLTSHFTANSDVGDADIAWDFGDGQKATGPTATHVFQDAGNYTVTVTATSGGQTGTATQAVQVAAPGETPPPASDAGTVTPPPSTGGETTTPPAEQPQPGGETQEPSSTNTAPKTVGCSSAAGLAPLASAGLIALGALIRRRKRAFLSHRERE